MLKCATLPLWLTPLAYAAYAAWRKSAASRDQHVELAACWAHARRKLHEALDSSPSLAGWLIRQTGHLYAVERRLRGQRAGPALRNALRCSESWLAYERISKAVTLLLRRRDVTPKSPLGMAIRYIHGLWPRLGVFLRDGRVEADTNLVENAIRPTAVGKRNWLFVGSAEGGWKAAVFHTLIGNCRRLGIDPHAYLKVVLERLPSASRRDLPGLLPAAWAGYGLRKRPGIHTRHSRSADARTTTAGVARLPLTVQRRSHGAKRSGNDLGAVGRQEVHSEAHVLS